MTITYTIEQGISIIGEGQLRYNGRAISFIPGFVRDKGEIDVWALLHEQFAYSCDYLVLHIRELKKLKRAITATEREKLTYLLRDVLELSLFLENKEKTH